MGTSRLLVCRLWLRETAVDGLERAEEYPETAEEPSAMLLSLARKRIIKKKQLGNSLSSSIALN